MLSATALETQPLQDAAELEERFSTPWPSIRAGRLGAVPVTFAVSGVGKVNAAAALAVLVGRGSVGAVVQVGIGGTYPGADVEVGDAALAGSELDLDLGVGSHPQWQGVDSLAVPGDATRNRLDLGGPTNDRVAMTTGLTPAAFATSDSVTADPRHAEYLAQRFSVAVESMEGAGAARVAKALGVPFIELRGISNVVGDRDKANWRVADAIARACAAAERAVMAAWEVTHELAD